MPQGSNYDTVPSEQYHFNSVMKSLLKRTKAYYFSFMLIHRLEAVCCKCFPLCPNSLVYPEIFPSKCLLTKAKEEWTDLVNGNGNWNSMDKYENNKSNRNDVNNI